MYDYVFEWLRVASKEERHCEEMEAFAKKHPIIFMRFHKQSGAIVNNNVNSAEYLDAKKSLIDLFDKNKEEFKPVFEAIKRMKQ